MHSSALLANEKKSFETDGYVVIKGLLKPAEAMLLKRAVESCEPMQTLARQARARWARGERAAFETIFVWNDVTGDDIFCKATRRETLFSRLKTFFDDEVYLYHNKVVLKYPGTEGFRFHQDYFYWYDMGNIYPDMAAVQIALDACTGDNGCLKVISGTHKLGRLNHTTLAQSSDSGVDDERLKEIMKRFPVVEIELAVGDAVLFHANLLHGSADNNSVEPRVTLLGCYNTKHNSPYCSSASGHPHYSGQKPLSADIVERDLVLLPDYSLMYE
jgi:ectoine hydroxylase-related dioxygenase (phytanoyl-CoA dioxygenase family)